MLEDLVDIQSSSWAVWSEDFGSAKCIEHNSKNIYNLINDNKNILKPHIIFMGLNRSGKKKSKKNGRNTAMAAFHNFHLPNKNGDRNLCDFIQKAQLNSLIGGYMTDINTRIVDPISHNVETNIEDENILMKQLRILGEKSYYIICFGKKTFDCFRDIIKIRPIDVKEIPPCRIKYFEAEYNDYYLGVFGVWHYSNWGRYKSKLQKLREQLVKLNDLCRLTTG